MVAVSLDPCCLLLFFLMSPRALRSPLFPYTTLFRSRSPLQFVCSAVAIHSLVYCGCVYHSGSGSSLLPGSECEELPLDRKSTRLNSSHGYISYAVFCLKKKNADSPMNAPELHALTLP